MLVPRGVSGRIRLLLDNPARRDSCNDYYYSPRLPSFYYPACYFPFTISHESSFFPLSTSSFALAPVSHCGYEFSSTTSFAGSV